MKFTFERSKSLIRVLAFVHGPDKVRRGNFALDTGATKTCISPTVLHQIGHDVGLATNFATLTTGNGNIRLPSVAVVALRCLGQTKADFTIHVLSFPPSSGIVGLFGLDFLQGRKLCIDYRDGTIELP